MYTEKPGAGDPRHTDPVALTVFQTEEIRSDAYASASGAHVSDSLQQASRWYFAFMIVTR